MGHLHYSPLLQRRTAATEAQYLLMRYLFDDLGYRRYEWKCNALNAASRAAAVLDTGWPDLRAGFETWLDPANWPDGFSGAPRRSLAACRAAR